ncbi:MAG TPA: hypothetical protein VFZ48_02880 [Candidatus Saccharimonadales bacterium]
MNTTITPETQYKTAQPTQGEVVAAPAVELQRHEEEAFRSIVKGLGDAAAERAFGIPPTEEYQEAEAMANPATFDEVVAPAHIRRQQEVSQAQFQAAPEVEKPTMRSRLRKLGSLAVTKLFGIPSSSSAYYQEGFDRRDPTERPQN